MEFQACRHLRVSFVPFSPCRVLDAYKSTAKQGRPDSAANFCTPIFFLCPALFALGQLKEFALQEEVSVFMRSEGNGTIRTADNDTHELDILLNYRPYESAKQQRLSKGSRRLLFFVS